MAFAEKILWVVNYENLGHLLTQVVTIGATGVAIRTDNDIRTALPLFHVRDIKVFGWRWPSAARAAAMAEAAHAAGLLAQGMDGYYVDPEGAPGEAYDWDLPGLDQVAVEFCQAVTAAGPGKPFGVTSHFRARAIHPHLPWAAFFTHATVLLPQAYWRVDDGPVHHGRPDENYAMAINAWTQAGGAPGRIVPMAGEIAHATPAEINLYAQTAQTHGVTSLHFYTDEAAVPGPIWQAIGAL